MTTHSSADALLVTGFALAISAATALPATAALGPAQGRQPEDLPLFAPSPPTPPGCPRRS